VRLTEGDIAALVKAAQRASRNAYVPYSRFPVGAAVITEDGAIFSGANVENASYGLTNCAERTAIFSMASNGQRKLAGLVIYTPTRKPAAPCGACRQVINEFNPQTRVICVCRGGGKIDLAVSELLPNAFGPGNLEQRAPTRSRR
jgi:cytidine deaminase